MVICKISIPGGHMATSQVSSTTSAATKFIQSGKEQYAYRRFGSGSKPPLLCLQHFTGTLDNWDPAVTDPLASEREVILFESAGIGRSGGTVPNTVAGMATHALAFMDGLGLTTCDVLGYSLGGMVAQEMALKRPSVLRRLILVGTPALLFCGGRNPLPGWPTSAPKQITDPKITYTKSTRAFLASNNIKKSNRWPGRNLFM